MDLRARLVYDVVMSDVPRDNESQTRQENGSSQNTRYTMVAWFSDRVLLFVSQQSGQRGPQTNDLRKRRKEV